MSGVGDEDYEIGRSVIPQALSVSRKIWTREPAYFELLASIHDCYKTRFTALGVTQASRQLTPILTGLIRWKIETRSTASHGEDTARSYMQSEYEKRVSRT